MQLFSFYSYINTESTVYQYLRVPHGLVLSCMMITYTARLHGGRSAEYSNSKENPKPINSKLYITDFIGQTSKFSRNNLNRWSVAPHTHVPVKYKARVPCLFLFSGFSDMRSARAACCRNELIILCLKNAFLQRTCLLGSQWFKLKNITGVFPQGLFFPKTRRFGAG